MCIETNEVFNSLSEAVKKYKTKTISECANGKQKTAAGKHWKWIQKSPLKSGLFYLITLFKNIISIIENF